MGYVAGFDLDPEQCHEGWVAMTYADGKVSSGTSNSVGHYLDGYTYLPDDSVIDPAYLRPNAEVTGWVPRCECGWRGVEVPLPESARAEKYPDPSDEQEQLVMDQWRLHLRQDVVRLSLVGPVKNGRVQPEDGYNAQHIARHDPARVLAECEAKRRIVDLHADLYAGLDMPQTECAVCPGLDDWPCETIRALALPYADHPDYREEWKP